MKVDNSFQELSKKHIFFYFVWALETANSDRLI